VVPIIRLLARAFIPKSGCDLLRGEVNADGHFRLYEQSKSGESPLLLVASTRPPFPVRKSPAATLIAAS
jgi:hypothetical protein